MPTLKYFITSKAKRNLLKFFLTDINASYYVREAARLTGEPLNAVRRELGYLEKAGLLRSYMQGNLKYYDVVKSFPLLAEWRKIIIETADVHILTEEAAAPIIAPSPVIAVSRSCEPKARQEAKQSVPVIAPSDIVITPTGIVIASKAKQSVPEQSPTLDSVIARLSEKFNGIKDITLAIIHGEAARSEKIPVDGIELLVVGDINKDILLELIASLEVTMGIDISLMHLTSSGFDYRNAQGDPFIRRIWGEKKLVVKGRH
jgi:DNA-binding transcriptional ArsR family regulator